MREAGTAADAAFAGEARSHSQGVPPKRLWELALQAERADGACPGWMRAPTSMKVLNPNLRFAGPIALLFAVALAGGLASRIVMP